MRTLGQLDILDEALTCLVKKVFISICSPDETIMKLQNSEKQADVKNSDFYKHGFKVFTENHCVG